MWHNFVAHKALIIIIFPFHIYYRIPYRYSLLEEGRSHQRLQDVKHLFCIPG